MRTIKFRAWDIRNKQMREVMGIRTNKDGTTTINATEFYDNWEPLVIDGKHKDGILMQYTGLKDKKGIEIYEGDIVKVKVDDRPAPFLVMWQHDKMRFGLQYPEQIDLADSWAFTPENDFRVIGNIYKNPKLLKKSGADEKQ